MSITLKVVKKDGTVLEKSTKADDTISVFKKAIAESVGIPSDEQRVIHKGKILKDDTTLQENSISDGAQVFVVRSKPSAVPPSETTNSSVTGSQTKTPAAGGPSTTTNPVLAGGMDSSTMAAMINNMMNSQGANAHRTLQQSAQGMQSVPPANPTQAAATNPVFPPAMDPNVMSQMISNPMIQQMLSNPETIRSMLRMNPLMGQMFGDMGAENVAQMMSNPMVQQIMSNPELMRTMMQGGGLGQSQGTNLGGGIAPSQETNMGGGVAPSPGVNLGGGVAPSQGANPGGGMPPSQVTNPGVPPTHPPLNTPGDARINPNLGGMNPATLMAMQSMIESNPQLLQQVLANMDPNMVGQLMQQQVAARNGSGMAEGMVECSDPASEYRPQLTSLAGMGFTDENLNIEVLRQVQGNVDLALDILLTRGSNA